MIHATNKVLICDRYIVQNCA